MSGREEFLVMGVVYIYGHWLAIKWVWSLMEFDKEFDTFYNLIKWC